MLEMIGSAARDWIRRRVVAPVVAVAKTGVSPERIALSIAAGLVLGVFPVVGATTLLCLVAAVGLRLNLVVVQLFNYLVYPLQIALLVPFLRLGEHLLRLHPMSLGPTALQPQLTAGIGPAAAVFAAAGGRAVLGWLPVAPLAAAAICILLAPLLARIPRSA